MKRPAWLRWHGTLARMRAHPERIARGFAVGLFIGMLPGAGVLAALALAFLLRLHKPAVTLGALVNNPWTTPFFYLAAYQLGKRLTGFESNLAWNGWHSWQDAAWWTALLRMLRPTLLGTVLIGAALALVGYAVVYLLLRDARRPGSGPRRMDSDDGGML